MSEQRSYSRRRFIGLQGYGVNLPVKDNLTRSMNAWRKLSR